MSKSKKLLKEARAHIHLYCVFELSNNRDNSQVYKADAVEDRRNKYEQSRTELLKEVKAIVDGIDPCHKALGFNLALKRWNVIKDELKSKLKALEGE